MSNSAAPAKRPALDELNAGTTTKRQKLADHLKKPSFSAPHELVTFHIGPDLTPFMVHKEVACLYCPVFKAAFNSNFIEGQTQIYKIDDTTVNAFQYVVYWFYSQKLKTCEVSLAEIKEWSINIVDDAIANSRIRQIFKERCFSLCRVWVLAHRLQIPRLQNLVIDELERTRVELGFLDLAVLDLIYDPKQPAVPKGAVLREYFVETIRKCAGAKAIEACQELFPRELLLECVIAYKRAAKGPDPFKDKAEFKKRFHVSEDL